MKKLISIRISDKDDRRLKKMAANEQCSQSEIISRALAMFEKKIIFDK